MLQRTKPVPDWLQRLRTKAWRKRVREWEQINLEWRKEMAERCKGSQVEWMGNMLRRAEQLPTEEQQVAWDGELKARAEAGCRK
jgi:hypothetical protein